MHENMNIDPTNGHVSFGLLKITPKTTTSDLDDAFSIGEEVSISVAGKTVSCQFAKAALESESTKFDLSLRFEAGILVSVFIHLSDSSISTKAQADFYKALKPLKTSHEYWLKKQIGENSTNPMKFKWGVIGVAQDRSDNISIYLHNRNNTWAFDS
jgi:hypothetical protein